VRKWDNWIIEQFDKGTTLLQKKGIIPLNTLIMISECLFWGSLIAHGHIPNNAPDLIFVVFVGIFLFAAYYRWQKAVGYWENQRKTQDLNAQVLSEREKSFVLRFITVVTFTPILVLELIVLDFIGAIGSITLITNGYLRCCRYMGPGDYARERKTSVQGLTQGNA
jgi:hypothetical protein